MRTVWRVAIAVAAGARKITDLAGLLVIVAVAIACVIQFPHPKKWDAFSTVAAIQHWSAVVMGPVARFFEMKWPPVNTVGRLMPLALIPLVLMARAIVHGACGRVSGWARAALARPVRRVRTREAVATPPAVRVDAVPLTAFAPAPAAAPHVASRTPPAVATPDVPVPMAAVAPPAAPTPLAAGPAGPPPAEPAMAVQGTVAAESIPLSTFLAIGKAGARAGVVNDPTMDDISGQATVDGRAPTMEGRSSTVPSVRPRSGGGRIPTRIGRYDVIEELGRGAMGVVYKGYDPQIGRTVAIKTILSGALNEEGLEAYKQRFFREAKACGQLSHPNIVAVHDLTEDDTGQPCLVMEFVDGFTLERLVAQDRLPLGQAVETVSQVADALGFAHDRNVIHRDVKPANILVTRSGRAKLTDFGIAKVQGAKLTQTGQLIGTPAFMSPEQFMGLAVDRRSDIFSLGAVLYWLCTNEKPFPGETITAIAYKVVQTAPVPARQLNPALPIDIDSILSRCLAKSADDRYQTGAELVADLEAFRQGRPLSARRGSAAS